MPRRNEDCASVNCLASVASVLRVTVGADGGRPDGAVAGDDEAARQHLVARILGDGERFAGEHRLIEAQTRRFEHHPVDGDLASEPQLDHVVEHDLVGCDLDRRTVADDGSRAVR